MRISRLDKLLAINRHPEFIKDLQEYKKIRRLHNPNLLPGMEYQIESKWGEPISRIMHAEKHRQRVKIGKNPFSCVSVVTSIGEKPIVAFKSGDGKTTKRRWNEGNYLYLKVDLNSNRKTLRRDFLKVIDRYLERLNDSSRERENIIDQWAVYDKYQSDKNLLKIARKLSGLKGNPTYNPQLEAFYRQVERALKKALKMIDSVSPK